MLSTLDLNLFLKKKWMFLTQICLLGREQKFLIKKLTAYMGFFIALSTLVYGGKLETSFN